MGADDVEIPIAGRWSLSLEVLIDDFDKAVFRTEIPVGTVGADRNEAP